MSNETCTCPSGDGSLRHPCSVHPPVGELKMSEVELMELFEIDCLPDVYGNKSNFDKRGDGKYFYESIYRLFMMWQAATQDGWIKCSDQSVPDIPVGTEREFSVFVKNSLGKTRVTTAWYLNQSELYNEDGSEEDGYDEEGMRKETGWFVLLNRHDEGMYVECDDEILMFQPLPQPPKEQS